jgi:hypothetical protein
MKYAILITIALLTLSACEQRTNDSSNLPATILVSAISDLTDPHVLRLQSGPLLRHFTCEMNPDAAFHFRLLRITDKMMNPIKTVTLPSSNMTEQHNRVGDPQSRKKAIISFYHHVTNEVDQLRKIEDSIKFLTHSEVFRTIAGELRYLVEHEADRKTLFVASDCRERSTLLDVYKETPKSDSLITGIFEGTHLLPDTLRGITVYFLFSPNDRKEDQMFALIVSAYRLLLEPRGATIHIQAQL